MCTTCAHIENRRLFGMNFKNIWIFVIAITASLIVSCGGAMPPLHIPGNTDHLDDIYNSVVAMVEVGNGGMRGPYCTASFVSPKLLVTAAHCVVHEEAVEVAPGVSLSLPGTTSPVGDEIQFVTFHQYDDWSRVANATEHNNPEYMTAIVVEIDTENNHDVALLELKDRQTPSPNWLVMRNLEREPLRPGEEAYSIGMPVGQIWVLTNGIISRIQIRGNNSIDILHQVRTGPGSSGSPIMDFRGRIVGIHSAGWSSNRSGTVVGEAKPISYIQTLIRILETSRSLDNLAQIGTLG